MQHILERWGRFVARWPLLIIVAWIVLALVARRAGPSLDAVSQTQNTSSLPASAPSVRAAQLYATTFAAGRHSANTETDLFVLTDPRGILPPDRAEVTTVRAWLLAPATRPAHLVTVTGPFASRDGQALGMTLTWDTTSNTALSPSITTVNNDLARQPVPAGGTMGLTGNAPIAESLTSSILPTGSSGGRGRRGVDGGPILGLLIILVVLGFVYRSPLAVLVPLVSLGLAFLLSTPIIAWFGQHLGIAVASFSLEYVGFVLLGVGTNYGVFLLSRYKEEIRRGAAYTTAARREALARAVGHVGEAILSSAATVVIAMAILGVAQLYTLRVTGTAIAIGVACLLLAGLSLLPALMALCGRALFWPTRPCPHTLTDADALEQGIWARAGRLVTTHPRLVTLVTLVVLLPLAGAALTVQPSFDDLKSLPATATPVRAFSAYSAHFHATAPARVLLDDPGHDLRQARYRAAMVHVAAVLTGVSHMRGLQAPLFATDGSAVALTVALDVDPSSQTARQTIDALYTTTHHALHGTALSSARVLVGGQSAQVRDQAIQFGHDLALVVTLVCVAIYIILALLVRSVTAPVYLLGTIALSALTAIGLTNLVYSTILGYPLFEIVPIFAFVFLVSLGEDFNILTMARIREEVTTLGTRRGIAAAVARTGGVVSSCGLVMAASFLRLISIPVVEIAELGCTVVVGVLLDTFIIRPLLVPAVATLLGRWNWVWPRSPLFARQGVTQTPERAR